MNFERLSEIVQKKVEKFQPLPKSTEEISKKRMTTVKNRKALKNTMLKNVIKQSRV